MDDDSDGNDGWDESTDGSSGGGGWRRYRPGVVKKQDGQTRRLN